MKELVEVIAKALVDNPEEVVVTESEKEDEIVIELKVAASDVGKVIGKQGRNRQSHSFCCKSSRFKRRKESYCRYSVALGPPDTWKAVFFV